jgi:hypothetical protein
MNYFEFVCVYSSRCKALAPTRLVAPPTDRGHRPYRNADGRYERAGVGEFPPSPNARFFSAAFRRSILSFRVENVSALVDEPGKAKSCLDRKGRLLHSPREVAQRQLDHGRTWYAHARRHMT